MGAPIESRLVKTPFAIVGPERILELVLHIEEPYRDRGAQDHHRRLHEKKRSEPITQISREDDAAIAAFVPMVLIQG